MQQAIETRTMNRSEPRKLVKRVDTLSALKHGARIVFQYALLSSLAIACAPAVQQTTAGKDTKSSAPAAMSQDEITYQENDSICNSAQKTEMEIESEKAKTKLKVDFKIFIDPKKPDILQASPEPQNLPPGSDMAAEDHFWDPNGDERVKIYTIPPIMMGVGNHCVVMYAFRPMGNGYAITTGSAIKGIRVESKFR